MTKEKFLKVVYEILENAGLIIPDGHKITPTKDFVRCGTVGKPNGKDGSYKYWECGSIAGITYTNFRTGEHGTVLSKDLDQLSSKERKEYERHIKEREESAKKNDQDRYQEWLKESKPRFDKAEEIPDGSQDHPYLKLV